SNFRSTALRAFARVRQGPPDGVPPAPECPVEPRHPGPVRPATHSPGCGRLPGRARRARDPSFYAGTLLTMHPATSAVSAPLRPLGTPPYGGGSAVPSAARTAAARPGAPRTRLAAGAASQPASGRLDLSGPHGAQLRAAIASVHRICP